MRDFLPPSTPGSRLSELGSGWAASSLQFHGQRSRWMRARSDSFWMFRKSGWKMRPDSTRITGHRWPTQPGPHKCIPITTCGPTGTTSLALRVAPIPAQQPATTKIVRSGICCGLHRQADIPSQRPMTGRWLFIASNSAVEDWAINHGQLHAQIEERPVECRDQPDSEQRRDSRHLQGPFSLSVPTPESVVDRLHWKLEVATLVHHGFPAKLSP